MSDDVTLLAGRLMKLEIRVAALERHTGGGNVSNPKPVCRKCNDTGVIRYGGGRELDCECQESPFKKLNNKKGGTDAE